MLSSFPRDLNFLIVAQIIQYVEKEKNLRPIEEPLKNKKLL